jgi:hypothetical protein
MPEWLDKLGQEWPVITAAPISLKPGFRRGRRPCRPAERIAHQFHGDFGVAAEQPFCPILVSALGQARSKPVEYRHAAGLEPNPGHLAPLLQQQVEKYACRGLELTGVANY